MKTQYFFTDIDLRDVQCRVSQNDSGLVINHVMFSPPGPLTVDIIKQGIYHLKERTCLKFVELPKHDSQQKSYVKFFSGDG